MTSLPLVDLNSYVFVSRFQGATEGLPHTLKLIWRPPPYLTTSSHFCHITTHRPPHLATKQPPHKQPAIPSPSPQLELIVALVANPVIVQHRHASSILGFDHLAKKQAPDSRNCQVTKSEQKCTAAQNEQICASEQKEGQILFSESGKKLCPLEIGEG